MNLKMTATIPKRLADAPDRLRKAIRTGMDAAAEALKVDFEATANTWSDAPAFRIERPDDYTRIVSTDHEVWGMLDEGTRAHTIRARNARVLRFQTGFRAKTRPGVLGSSGGGASGPAVTARQVQHPGTAPRRWTYAAKEKYDKELPRILQRAIDAAVR